MKQACAHIVAQKTYRKCVTEHTVALSVVHFGDINDIKLWQRTNM